MTKKIIIIIHVDIYIYYYIMDYGVGSELFFTSLLSNARDKAVYKVKVCIFHGSFFFLLL